MTADTTFKQAYTSLNSRQKQAVDTIEGPVMVVAGPGTGKTQLLSMRVANILRHTDALPNNILCLTFTESGATAMRERLVSLMGQGAYKVAIHTFHSFGAEVINHHPEYFYQGAHFRAADELSSYEVLEPIFKQLPHSNPLASTMNGEFTALRDVQSGIADLKKAGLTPDELLKICDHNETFINLAEPILARAFDTPRFSKKNLPGCEQALEELRKIPQEKPPVALIKPLQEVCIHELQRALEAAAETGSTQPMTAFRTRWIERDRHKQFVFKDRARIKKLRALADIYHKYLLGMQERELYDFDDMILRVVHALEYFSDLRYNLQELYQYILVDEFQDTNGAQLRLLRNLTGNEINEGRPNILVVGDDDQAIYAFQGADISNILQFHELYRDPTVITLVDNYRSTEAVLTSAREVIVQGQQRLEVAIDEIDKTLTPHRDGPQLSELHQLSTPVEQYHWIIAEIQQLVKSGVSPNEIAVLGRNHRQLLEILPYLRQSKIAVNYERRNNVLEAEHIVALTLLARVVVALEQQRFDIAEALLPELLSQPFWGIKTDDLWKLSLAAYKQNKLWLELMLDEQSKFRPLAEFLVVSSHEAHHEPLEVMLDRLIGSVEPQAPEQSEAEIDGTEQAGPDEEVFISPLRGYYFNAARLDRDPTQYLTLLSNLAVIRRKLREYRPDQPLSLSDFVAFIDLHQKTGMSIVDTSDHHEDGEAIQLMTAHKSKGLEFDAVFVLSCQENIWGEKARTRTSSIRFPHNLPISAAGQTADDCLRLFFVAMTRARERLYLCAYRTDDAGKDSLLVSFLQTEAFAPIDHAPIDASLDLAATLEPNWQQRHIQSSPATKESLLQPVLESYHLSATHLNNFIDVTNGGPQAFLLQNLLRFPQAMGANAAFGSAIHAVLQRAHVHLASSGERRPVEDILHDFEIQLQNARLSEPEFNHWFERGSDVLPAYLQARYDSFMPEQIAEYSFRGQGVVVGGARLTGAIDLMDIDKDSHDVIVTDYKTGRAVSSWQGKTEYEKIKLHKYRQQLMLYKLLVEGSRDFGSTHTVRRGVIEFVEPDEFGAIQRLHYEFTPEEMDRFKALVHAIWQHIMTLDLPDTSKYPTNYKGVLMFEDDLLGKT